MGNLFGIRKAVKGISQASQDVLNKISREVTETRILLTEVTNKTLQRIDEELTQTRVFLTEKAWPEVNRTMTQFRGTLDQADKFFVTSTSTVKVLALLSALCAAYMIHKMISERQHVQWWQRRRVSNFTIIINAFLDILLCLCLVLAFTLVLQLLKEHFNILWPRSIPIILLIPSLTTLAVLFQHLVAILKALFTFLRLIPYVIIEYPVNKGLDPVTKGAGYMRAVPLLQILSYIILYPLIVYGAFLLAQYLIESEKSILKSMLIIYVVFYGSTLLISITYSYIISPLIRCIWAYWARRNLERKNQ